MLLLDHVRVEDLVFRGNMFKRCVVIKTTVRVRHEDICLVIPEEFYRSRGLHKLVPNDNSAVDCFLGAGGDDGNSSSSGSSSSWPLLFANW